MKKTFLLSFLIISYQFVSAQFVAYSYNKDIFQEFLKTTKTYVVKSGIQELDELMADALKKHWTVKPYEMISREEAFKKMYDPSFSFLMPMVVQTLNKPNITNVVKWDKTDKPYDPQKPDHYMGSLHGTNALINGSDFLAVLIGGPKKYYPDDMIAFAPFDRDPDIMQVPEVYKALYRVKFRLQDMVAGINRSLEMVRDRQLDFMTVKDGNCRTYFFNQYKKDIAQLKTKTLYILKSDFGKIKDLESVPKVYPYKFELVDMEEYQAAISEAREGTLYLLVTHNDAAGLQVIDPHEHKTIGGMDYGLWLTKIDAGDIKKVAALAD